MQSLQMALGVSVPLMIYMAVGVLIRRLKFFSAEQFIALNGLLFRFFLPVHVFNNIYSADLKEAVNPGVFAFVGIGTVLTFCIAFPLSACVTKDKKDRATMIQGSFRSNFVLFGSIVATTLCDERGVSLVAALSVVAIPVYNILAVLLFARMTGGDFSVKKLLIDIAKNPLVEASVLGGLFSFLHIPIPALIASPISGIAGAATPVALITLGGILSADSLRADFRKTLFSTSLRLIAFPLAAVLIAFFVFGYRSNELAAILAVFAGPTAVSTTPMAQMMGGNGTLAAEIVATSSVFCLFTLFLFVYVLSYTGLL